MSILRDHINDIVDGLLEDAEDPDMILDMLEHAIAGRRQSPTHAPVTATYEYVTDPEVPEAVHLTDSNPTVNLTLCGRWTAGWTIGDETVSGVATTCRPCLDEFHNQRGKELSGG